MQTLIRDLLQVSRVETGAKPLEPTDAAEVVAGALRVARGPAPRGRRSGRGRADCPR